MNNKTVTIMLWILFGIMGVLGILRMAGVLVPGEKFDITKDFNKEPEQIQVESMNQHTKMKATPKEECPGGICVLPGGVTEKKCDTIGGLRDARSGNCIDTFKQDMREQNLEREKECDMQGGEFKKTKQGVMKCFAVYTDGGKKCKTSDDCSTKLCQVTNNITTEGTCNAMNPFQGCGKFLNHEGKVVVFCN